jgi:catechol 2,3-dioxygenase-like lactoylglutathione lyase family enzyme
VARAEIAGISPFFLVRHVTAAISFYCDRLGFDLACKEPDHDPFFACCAIEK